MKRSLSILFLAIFAISLTTAASTCLTINSKNTNDYLNELPSLNSQLSTCTIVVPSNANFIVSDGNVLVEINMNDGTTRNMFVTIKNNEVESFNSGTTSTFTHTVTLSEGTLDNILNSNDAANEILKGIKNKDITIKANSIVGKVKWFFAKFFLPSPATTTSPNIPSGPTGKPDNCDETYLPGHREYSNNKELWDGYSSNTDKVCQSQFGRGTPSPCIHSVQLSIDGNPYYLCWYND